MKGVAMQFKANEIRSLLASHQTAPGDSAAGPPTCDVVYAMFLEPTQLADPRWSTLECAIDKAVRVFQPTPALAHCEMLVPPVPCEEGLRTNFATYFGRNSGWQTDKADGYNYYLVENAGRWRAVPIFQLNAGAAVRNECDMELGVHYSLARYLTAVAPLRWTASLVSDKRRSPAHCATLTARVLKNSGVYMPLHASAWYGPTTLYQELCHQATWRAERMGADAFSGMPLQTAQNIEQLVRGVMSPRTVAEVGDAGCLDAVRGLTLKTCAAFSQADEVTQRITQQQLASALLRWVVLRGVVDPSAGAGSDEETTDPQDPA